MEISPFKTGRYFGLFSITHKRLTERFLEVIFV